MASIIAAPTSLDITAVAGDPLTLLFDISLADSNGNPLPWSDFTSPTVYVGKATAEQTSLEPVVTMPATGQVQLAWSGTQTASIGNSSGLLWSLSATISGTGPLALTAGNLTANPATTPGNSSGSSGNLSVNVGLATVSLSVTVGGGGGSSSGVSELTDGTGTTTGIVTIQGAGGVTVSVSKTGTNGTITVTGDLAPSFTGAGQLLVGTGRALSRACLRYRSRLPQRPVAQPAPLPFRGLRQAAMVAQPSLATTCTWVQRRRLSGPCRSMPLGVPSPRARPVWQAPPHPLRSPALRPGPLTTSLWQR